MPKLKNLYDLAVFAGIIFQSIYQPAQLGPDQSEQALGVSSSALEVWEEQEGVKPVLLRSICGLWLEF